MTTENPFESPRDSSTRILPNDVDRRNALFHLRLMLCILLIPAIYNYYAFDRQVFAGARYPTPIYALERIVNIGAILVGSLLIWYFALAILEWLSRTFRHLFAGAVDRNAWTNSLYSSLQRAMYLSIAGSMLWAIWVYAFYSLDADFYVISWAVGIPAHLLAACWYIPLFVTWYKLRKAAKAA